jgi:hypothetical protein
VSYVDITRASHASIRKPATERPGHRQRSRQPFHIQRRPLVSVSLLLDFLEEGADPTHDRDGLRQNAVSIAFMLHSSQHVPQQFHRSGVRLYGGWLLGPVNANYVIETVHLPILIATLVFSGTWAGYRVSGLVDSLPGVIAGVTLHVGASVAGSNESAKAHSGSSS